jgi:hypothetical protein
MTLPDWRLPETRADGGEPTAGELPLRCGKIARTIAVRNEPSGTTSKQPDPEEWKHAQRVARQSS